MLYSNVLVAYDGSQLGDKALDYAMELATRNGDVKIHVVHVVDQPDIYPYTYMMGNNMNEDEGEIKKIFMEMEQGREVIEKAEGKLSKLNDQRYDTQLIEGQPSEEILNYAKQEKCDLIIMGSRGLSNIKELFLGSVSHHIVQRSEVPVLIIK